MATKPAGVPVPWATIANFAQEFYPVGHPLEGQETPWSQQPRIDGAVEAIIAPKGYEPGVPVAAVALNSREGGPNGVDAWLAWLLGGSAFGGENTHLVETDGTGKAKVDQLEVGDGMGVEVALIVVGGGGNPGLSVDGGGHVAAALANSSSESTLGVINLGAGLSLEVFGEGEISTGNAVALEVSNNSGANPTLRLFNAGAGLALEVLGPMTSTGPYTPQGGINLLTFEIVGTIGSRVAADVLEGNELRLSEGTTIPAAPGRFRWWRGTTPLIGTFGGGVKSLAVPFMGYDEAFSTPNAIDSTTASTTRRVHASEPVRVLVVMGYENNTPGKFLNYNLQITGPLGVVVADAVQFPIVPDDYPMPFARAFVWTPTDDWPAETDPQNYVFVVRVGHSPAGGTTSCENIMIDVDSRISL